jgi:hypothetical protein
MTARLPPLVRSVLTIEPGNLMLFLLSVLFTPQQ